MRRKIFVVLAALSFLLSACNRDRAENAANEHADHTTGGTAVSSTNTASTDTASTIAAAPVKPGSGQVVHFGNGASGYLSAPATPGQKPGVIVIQEWWGVNDWVKQQADRLADKGYVALAVDLYRGRSTANPDEAHELMRGMPEDRAIADLKAGVDYLSQLPDVDPKHIGSIGWCMGGGYSLALATNDKRVNATVINYGRLVTDPGAISRINGPVLGNFGATDRGIAPADVKAFGAALTAMGKLGDIKIYDGAGHAFMNPNNTEGYNAAAADDAQGRIDAFFDRNLRAKIPNS
jgi:carboxymethylenebutenolidase